LLGFVEIQKQKWNEKGRIYSSKLRGTASGDNDWARESLGFGFHMENTYWGICRIWSRSWLLTKCETGSAKCNRLSSLTA
jgi:hypothetical protein